MSYTLKIFSLIFLAVIVIGISPLFFKSAVKLDVFVYHKSNYIFRSINLKSWSILMI